MTDSITAIPEGFGAEWKDVTNIHPLGLAAAIVLGILLLSLPRRYALLPMIIMACLVSAVQKITVFSLDFNLMRVLVLFGVVRLLIRNETHGFRRAPVDSLLILWMISAVAIRTLRMGTFSVFVNRLGFAFDAMGMYFLFRCLICDWRDFDALVFGSILISIPVAVVFLVEHTTGRNLFSVFGGVPAVTMVREGRLRCQGPFSHPILAGCFWASMIPLFGAFAWKGNRERVWATVGLICSLTVVVTCASGTPVISVIAAILGAAMFVFRYQMRLIRWGTVAVLVGLHIVMNAPVWALIARAGAIVSGTAWHRYKLVNEAINHVGQWWLMGTPSTAEWGYGMFDVTNQYVLQGVEGGLLTLGLFVAIITVAFRNVGQLWRCWPTDRYRLVAAWALGVTLFLHCVNFLSVTYFGQSHVVWYLLLATIGSLALKPASAGVLPKSAERSPVRW
jgi:hypothetical protein